MKVIQINKKIIISWLLVVLWGCLIFYMSSMDVNESNNKSKETINKIIATSADVNNESETSEKNENINNKNSASMNNTNINEINRLVEKYNVPFRKFAHASEYFVLIILLIIALKTLNIRNKKIYIFSILLCFLYACTDEYHQTFVNGRTGQLTDVLIDTIGGIIGCMFIIIINAIKIKVHKKEIIQK